MDRWIAAGAIGAWTVMVTWLIFGPDLRAAWHRIRARWTMYSLTDYDREVLDDAKVNW